MVGNVTIQGQITGTATFDGAKISAVVTIAPPINATVVFGRSGVTVHNQLTDRDADDVHPIEAISSPINDSSNVYGWIRSTLLTGLAAFTDTVIVSTDTILSAFAKLQGQLNAVKVRLGLLENRVITELTLTQDVEFVEFQLNGETDFEIQYSSMTGARSNSVNGYMTVNDISTQNYVAAITRYSGMLIYIGRYSFSGKIEVRLINNIVSFFNVVQQIWGLSSTPETKNITSRMQSGYLETPVSVITNIRITYPFNSGATFKLVRK